MAARPAAYYGRGKSYFELPKSYVLRKLRITNDAYREIESFLAHKFAQRGLPQTGPNMGPAPFRGYMPIVADICNLAIEEFHLVVPLGSTVEEACRAMLGIVFCLRRKERQRLTKARQHAAQAQAAATTTTTTAAANQV